MPKTYRAWIKRDLLRTISELDKQQARLVRLGSNYKDKYPVFYQAYSTAVATLEQLKNLLKDIHNNT